MCDQDHSKEDLLEYERRVARDRRETARAGPSPAQVTDSHGPAPAATSTRSRGFPRRRAVRRAACVPPLKTICPIN